MKRLWARTTADPTRRFRRYAIVAVATLAPTMAGAGGYLAVHSSGNPYKWTNPITLNYDQGPLSATVNNAAAAVLVGNAVGRWTTAQVSTSAVSFARGADLSEDHGDGLGSDPNYNEALSDGITPVVYDQTGLLTSALFAGAQNVVLGFAGPRWVSGSTITEGQVVLNGLFIDGQPTPPDVTQQQFEGVITHEVGHMLNLDHASFNTSLAYPGVPGVANDPSALPTMYPLSHSDIHDLEEDDIAWISNLYPTAAFSSLGAITGVARDAGGTLLNGVNVIARSATDPKRAISCVSGYLDPTPTASPVGVYRIPGLTSGTSWTLEFEQIPASFSSGSSVGPIDPPLTLPGPAEFINESGAESNSDSLTRSTTFDVPAGTLTGVDVRLNSVPSASNLSEVDPAGNTFPGEAMLVTNLVPGVPLVISGNLNAAEGGNIDFLGGDPVEDWYAIRPPAGVEITRIRLQPAAGDDADLYLVNFNSPSLNAAAVSLNVGAGVAEEVTGAFDNTLFVSSTAYIGVSTYTGFPGGNYTLTIDCVISKRDAVVLDSIPGGAVDVGSGLLTINGRGFKNANGTPTVTLGNPFIQVNSVTFVNSNQLNVNVSRLPGWTTGATDSVQVQNAAGDGGYAGRLPAIPTVPVTLSGLEIE